MAWKIGHSRFPALRTYAPMIGGAILIAVTILHFFGQHDAADAIATIGEAGGMTQQSPMSEEDLRDFALAIGSATALAYGIYRKAKATAEDMKAKKELGVPEERRKNP